MKKIAVIALGGNALEKKGEKLTVASQLKQVEKAAESIISISRTYNVITTFGNGPQVGSILIRSEEALGKTYSLPLEVCVAESEGEIGFMIELALQNKLRLHHKSKPVISLLSLVEVDKHDPAFKKPTKPIGPWYTSKQAIHLKKQGMPLVFVPGRGFRRIVPSPLPKKVDDALLIKKLAQSGAIVIAAGGGGIPVTRENGKLKGVAAVIDKDRASACLAKAVKAELLLILTDVDKVYLNYLAKNKKPISVLTAGEAKKLLKQNQFPQGSMGPKIEAAIDFLVNGGKKVIITSPERASLAIKGRSGTLIVP